MIGYAIVGCGHIAKKHVAALQAVKDAKLVAVCDTDPVRLEDFVNDEVKGYTSLDELLKDPQVEVVSICTPTGLHPKLTIQAAEAGKHVLVEKPMALSLEDADQMIDVCEKNHVKLAVVHPNRFRPAIAMMHKRLEEGAFGKLSHANATVRWNRNQAYYDQAAWRGTKAMDGGVLMNQAIHNMDLLLWMMGEAEEVSTYSATRLRNIETEDVSVSVIRFKNGALGVLEAAVTLYPRNLEESLSIFGEQGTAIIGGPTANWIKEWKFADLSEQEAAVYKEQIEADPFGVSGHQCMIEDLTEAIQENRTPLVSGVEGREVLKLVLACQRSADTGNRIKLEELEKNITI
ncbi:Predicted dehydrogenase [Seinonella peptonophila]|uniref:Predicted dehydrogenase n=1 Tax=Seinonella peptonophila TaxID=112248 RepID=A0A1M4XSL7_9BACL|nr:Gfo/Idh/MocA family oxidoreductase [Seinonella peptonophila]SHE96356.1 Predicted dehydrogenase [Seinonella peptonophila]